MTDERGEPAAATLGVSVVEDSPPSVTSKPLAIDADRLSLDGRAWRLPRTWKTPISTSRRSINSDGGLAEKRRRCLPRCSILRRACSVDGGRWPKVCCALVAGHEDAAAARLAAPGVARPPYLYDNGEQILRDL